MKTRVQIMKELTDMTGLFGFNPAEIKQGSLEWMTLKLGVISASNADCILAKNDSMMRRTYMCELVAQVCTGEFPEINAKSLAWGKDNEVGARSAYEFATGDEVEEVVFVFKDKHRRAGCSPDGLIKGKPKGLELKCPFASKTYIDFVTAGKIKSEYIKQCQFSMWVTDSEFWDFANYDPRMKRKMIHNIEVKRDDEMMKLFDDLVPSFAEDMDVMLKDLGVEFGEQWRDNSSYLLTI